ncbi:hypothetical protein [Roseomonas haemaphysalidis]|jgi:hypothetical protein|uniref:Lipoprotein n=1 Tax=Roseomonas haemaphysalidis TaxID=2768162 RepID=A0ABS3KPX2_9PROT|nr:hypothetical protein [Roseomonas haemaphysalidis]MBO1079482.1 hypothetical protein [Roseomonas haemaphysalidis]
MRGVIRILALAAVGFGVAGCVVYPASYYGPPARYGYYAPPPPPPPYYGHRYWR